MTCKDMERMEQVYPVTRAAVEEGKWDDLFRTRCAACPPAQVPELLATLAAEFELPEFLPELALLEWRRYEVEADATAIPPASETFALNPTVDLVELSWKLASQFADGARPEPSMIEPGSELALIWRCPDTGCVRVKVAGPDDLLALKIVTEDLAPGRVAHEEGVDVAIVEGAMYGASRQGILIGPRSLLKRDTELFLAGEETRADLVYADTFTLQWHITHACDLNCKHCYDRSKRSPLTLDQELAVLSDLRDFCRERHVRGHVCFSGGNPLLHPRFFELYQAAAVGGFRPSILGNPTDRETLERIVQIQKPGYFQVSLEGLEEHNDFIRGAGFYRRVIEFLDLLRDMDIEAAVMLTLTRDNMDQVIPLAEQLEGHADYFTFNRLSPVGQGADLLLPGKEEYLGFLSQYVEAAQQHPIMGYKDNLLSTVLEEKGLPCFDGCTGYGCGAAFNFIAVLPDGEAHACRKFPSPLGNVMTQTIADIYDSQWAQRYRRGAKACDRCEYRERCGGCLAVASGLGLDISHDRDPYCPVDPILSDQAAVAR